MQKYHVKTYWTETRESEVTVEAETREEAQRLAMEKFKWAEGRVTDSAVVPYETLEVGEGQ